MSTDTIKVLSKFLDYSSDEGKVLNQNIANTNTEGYQRREVNFSAYMKSAMEANLEISDEKHFSSGNPEIGENKVIIENEEVEIENEMAQLAKNTLNFKFATKRVSDYYNVMQQVIKSGG
jgi:flagellar basal-body rod protein FlgB